MTSIGYALAGPWLAVTGAGSIAGPWFHLHGVTNDWASFGWALPVIAGVASAGIARLTHARLKHPAVQLAWGGVLVTSGLMGWLFLRGASVSFEDRHFFSAALCILPALGILSLDTCSSLAIRAVCFALLITGCSVGAAAAAQRVATMSALPIGPISRCTSPDLPKESWAVIDAASHDALLFLGRTPVAFEFPGRRRIVTDAESRSSDDLVNWAYRGRVPKLVIALQRHLENDGRAALIRAAFRDYSPEDWHFSEAGRWCMWTAYTPARQ